MQLPRLNEPGRGFDICRAEELPPRPSRGGGGGRGIYERVDGDLPVALAARSPAGPFDSNDGFAGAAVDRNEDGRTDAPEHAVAHACDVIADTCIMHVNIQGLRSHLIELCAVIRLCATPPDIICVNETFLDESVENIELEGFEVVGRRDRSFSGDDRACGGVIIFARSVISCHVTLLLTSQVSERLWLQLHTDTGPYLLCAWYRPPAQGEVESIASFDKELGELRCHVLGTLLLGDLNLHSQRWLRHSARNSVEGETMRDLCSKRGLRQIIRGPTRGDYLLDLGITDIESASGSISTKIADHSIVTVRLNLALPQMAPHKRKVWSYLKADWDGLKRDLEHANWSFLECGDASHAAELMTKLILEKASVHIPQRTLIEKRDRIHGSLTTLRSL